MYPSSDTSELLSQEEEEPLLAALLLFWLLEDAFGPIWNSWLLAERRPKSLGLAPAAEGRGEA